MSSIEIRVGLIGYGYVGRTFHAPLVRSVPGLALRVVGSTCRTSRSLPTRWLSPRTRSWT